MYSVSLNETRELNRDRLQEEILRRNINYTSYIYNKDDVDLFDIKTVPTYELLEVDAFKKDAELKFNYTIFRSTLVN